jgi:hypothetical protein
MNGVDDELFAKKDNAMSVNLIIQPLVWPEKEFF